VDAAGAAFVTMSSAADACEHVASKRREPVIAVRQAVQAIVPPYYQLSKYCPFRLLSGPIGRCQIPEHPTSHISMQVAAINWNRAEFVYRSRVSPKADIHRAQVARSAICRRSATTVLVFVEMA
jgi:hypothetical protein